MKIVKVAAAIIMHGDKIFATQRGYGDFKDGWEFPGGKIEAGETEEEAIKREISEELDCQIEVDGLLPEMEYEYPDFILRMTICLCHLVSSSTPTCLEHNAIHWFAPDDLPTLDWAPADARCYPLVAAKILMS